MNTKEIAKKIRTELKKMTGYKFSITTEYFSGGSAINVNVMKSPIRIIRNMSEIPEVTNTINYNRDQIAYMQSKTDHQLNEYQLQDEYNPKSWNNGIFITEEGHNALQKIVTICKEDHWSKSDSQIDYFNTNFYLHLNLGKWNKDFIDGE